MTKSNIYFRILYVNFSKKKFVRTDLLKLLYKQVECRDVEIDKLS